MLGQCRRPEIANGRCAGLEAARQPVELRLHGLRHAGVQRGRFASNAGHRGFHHRLNRRAGDAGAFGQALFQRAVDRDGEPGIGRLRLAVKGVLVGEQALVQRLALLRHRRHHGLQPVGQLRHHFGLLLQQPERFVAPMRQRKDPQGRADARVERLRGLQPVPPTQRGDQSQHRRCGHARERGAERQPQALDWRCQRGADGRHVRCALQRHAGAVERDHHADESTEHAQQHQQPREVRRQGRAGQPDALALDAQAHRVAQGGVQRAEPLADVCRRLCHACHGTCQRGGGLVEALQFQRAHSIESADQQRDRQRQRVRTEVADGDPAHGGQADEESGVVKKRSAHGVDKYLLNFCGGLPAAPRQVAVECPAPPAPRPACRRGTCPATLRAGARCRVLRRSRRLALSGRSRAGV